MPIFIKLKEKDRIDLFNVLKKRVNTPWDEFYPSLKISRGSFFNYLSGRKGIPIEIFKILTNVAKIKIESFQEIERERYVEKKIVIPSFNNHLAEVLGILNGDGHLSAINYEISVVGNRLEKEYYGYLKDLFEEVFTMRFNLNLKDNYFKIKTYSKNLVNFLNHEYGLPLGNKMGKLRIPRLVFEEKNKLRCYIRGLYDTDGCFHVRRKKDPMISICSADSRFLADIRKALKSLRFNVAKGDQRAFIYRRADVNRFFREIKPANSKHLKKYQEWFSYSALVV